MLMNLENWSQTVTEQEHPTLLLYIIFSCCCTSSSHESWSQTVKGTPDTAVGTSPAMSPCSLLGAESCFEVDRMLEHIQLYVELMDEY
jgi:hypothetical protein